MLDKKALGAVIKKRRKEKKLKQTDVSAKTCLSRNYISDIENGRYAPSLDTVMKLADALGVTIDELVREEEGAAI